MPRRRNESRCVNSTESSTKPQQINAGDLMLFGSDCLVLFYESFSTSYSYTPLGYIVDEDVSGLAAAVGSGSILADINLVPRSSA